MNNIGAEIGQKMRSAIQAKLMELGCYVDDELPDYIMVMVANKRSKSQMNEDLNLFLSTKTSVFVNWLHIVLKKLKEVTVTNPEVYKKVSKRKNSEALHHNEKIKSEKLDKKIKEEIVAKLVKQEKLLETATVGDSKSLTDNLPLQINKFSEKRKIILTANDNQPTSSNSIAEDNFDIPLLSEVNVKLTDKKSELTNAEKISNAKIHAGDSAESAENSNNVSKQNEQNLSPKLARTNLAKNSKETIKLINECDNSYNEIDKAYYHAEKHYSESQNRNVDNPIFTTSKSVVNKSVHKRITYGSNIDDQQLNQPAKRKRLSDNSNTDWRIRSPVIKKLSLFDRLGKRSDDRTTERSRKTEAEERFGRYTSSSKEGSYSQKRRYRSKSKDKSVSRDEEFSDEDIVERPEVQSKVSVIKRTEVSRSTKSSDDEDNYETVIREVPSLIRVKPRVIPSDVVQPNKSLLLKAVAEAQRSVAQAPKVGKDIKPDALFTKRYKDKGNDNARPKGLTKRTLGQVDRNKLKALIKESGRNSIKSKLKPKSDDNLDDDNLGKEYIPQPLKCLERDVPTYVPSLIQNEASTDNELSLESEQPELSITFNVEKDTSFQNKASVKTRLDGRRVPSPIIFDKTDDTKVTDSIEGLDKLPIVRTPLSRKLNERCKYWPNCRQSTKCEYVHPSEQCKLFPNCKFGNRCLFIHPPCKFGNSCTKRNCLFDHNKMNLKLSLVSPKVQTCKYYPACTNKNCPYVHPKLSKYEKFVSSISDTSFSQQMVHKGSFTWKSK